MKSYHIWRKSNCNTASVAWFMLHGFNTKNEDVISGNKPMDRVEGEFWILGNVNTYLCRDERVKHRSWWGTNIFDHQGSVRAGSCECFHSRALSIPTILYSTSQIYIYTNNLEVWLNFSRSRIRPETIYVFNNSFPGVKFTYHQFGPQSVQLSGFSMFSGVHNLYCCMSHHADYILNSQVLRVWPTHQYLVPNHTIPLLNSFWRPAEVRTNVLCGSGLMAVLGFSS